MGDNGLAIILMIVGFLVTFMLPLYALAAIFWGCPQPKGRVGSPSKFLFCNYGAAYGVAEALGVL